MTTHAQIIQECWESVNRGDLEAFSKYFSESYVRHSGNDEHSLQDFRQILEERQRAFPDLKTWIKDVLVDGDRVAYRWESTGTHVADYLGIPPTNRPVVATGITISRISDGKFAEDWASWNKSSVLHSLGVFPIQAD